MQRSMFSGLFAAAFVVSTPLAVQAPAAFAQKAPSKAKAPPAPRPRVRVAVPTNCSSFYLEGRAPAATVPAAPAAAAGRIFCHMIYSVSYSVPMLNPLWSAEHLTRAAALGGDATFRTDRSSFQQQPELTRAQQAANADFAGNEWDLGHMAPANDAPDDASQNDTFFLTNVVPQEDNLNRILWAHLEASVHKIAEDAGEVYIVTGPIFGAHPPLMNNRVPIPDFTFKAIYIPSRRLAAGFIGRNNESATCVMVSVAEITRQTGIDPFPSLLAAVKATPPTLTLPDGVNVRRDGSTQRVPAPNCPAAP
ncbi:MAG: endonuclease mitochondrial [Sphingomonadales bacterium]|jgi:endonuclease G|nr:endonuclease mitochondrial [Sphingomonadales bacterium]